MAGDEIPSGQDVGGRFPLVRVLGVMLLIYTLWTAVYAMNTRQDVMLVGTGVGLVGLAVIATRSPTRQG
jgi:hypothetical protein